MTYSLFFWLLSWCWCVSRVNRGFTSSSQHYFVLSWLVGPWRKGEKWNCPGYLLTHTVLPNAVVLHSASWGFPAALESKYISIPVKQVTSSSCDLETILHLNEKTGEGAGRKLLLILESIFFLGWKIIKHTANAVVQPDLMWKYGHPFNYVFVSLRAHCSVRFNSCLHCVTI